MLYALICYDDDAASAARSTGGTAPLDAVRRKWGPCLRALVGLMPTTAATTLAAGAVRDGPAVAAREAPVAIALADADTLEAALALARDLAAALGGGACEVRPVASAGGDDA